MFWKAVGTIATNLVSSKLIGKRNRDDSFHQEQTRERRLNRVSPRYLSDIEDDENSNANDNRRNY